MKKFLTEKKKKKILIYAILWLLIAIVFVVPFAAAAIDSSYNGTFEMEVFTQIIGSYVLSIPIRVKAFGGIYKDNTMSTLGYYTFFYLGLMITLFLKSKSDGDYHDIEHGSSDWSEGGEQYKVLSKNSGLILAEKNFLPADKPGNVNVLIVGRIWCW